MDICQKLCHHCQKRCAVIELQSQDYVDIGQFFDFINLVSVLTNIYLIANESSVKCGFP